MGKYLVIIVFISSLFISKVYLDINEENALANSSKSNLEGQSLVSPSVYMNRRYKYLNKRKYK